MLGNSFVIFVRANDSLATFPSPFNSPAKSPPVKMNQLHDPPVVARLSLHRIRARRYYLAAPIVHGHNSKEARGITLKRERDVAATAIEMRRAAFHPANPSKLVS